VEVTAGPQAEGVLKLTIEFEQGRLERTIEVADCHLAASLAALTIAVAMDPSAVLDELEEARAVSDVPDPAPPPAPLRRGPQAGVGAYAIIGAGAVPFPSVGGRVSGQLRWRAGPSATHGPQLIVDAIAPQAAWLDPQGAMGDAAATARVLLARVAIGARECWEPRMTAISVPLCAGLDVGWILGEGRGLEENRSSRQVWLGLPVSTGLRVAVGRRLHLAADVETSINLVRPEFRVSDADLGHSIPALGLRGILGVEWRWPDDSRRRRPRQ